MTKEEAKKMGATHIDNNGHYWVKLDGAWYSMFRNCKNWNEHPYPYYLPLPELKPL